MSSVRWFHLTATVHPALIPLSGEDIGGWLWAHLRDAFPTALATVLMPDHPHLVIPTEDAEAAAARLARLLGQLGRRLGVLGRAGRVAAPEPIRSVAALARHVRYVALNPCRAGFASCPLAWPWSTHRDVVGACLDPWVTASRLALALQTTPIGFAARHHGYVSADPHVNVEGTPLPRPAATSMMSEHGLRAIAEAVASATRAPLEAVRRRGLARAIFFALAFDQGWTQTARLAVIGRCRPRRVRELVARVDAHALEVARLCLGDPRLRRLPARPPLDEKLRIHGE